MLCLFREDFEHNFRSGSPDSFEEMSPLGLVLNRAFPDAVVTKKDVIESVGNAISSDLPNWNTHQYCFIKASILTDYSMLL